MSEYNLEGIVKRQDAQMQGLREANRALKIEEAGVLQLRELLEKEDALITATKKSIAGIKIDIDTMEERERYLQEAVNGVLKSNSVLTDMEFQAKRNLETKNREIRSFQAQLEEEYRQHEVKIQKVVNTMQNIPQLSELQRCQDRINSIEAGTRHQERQGKVSWANFKKRCVKLAEITVKRNKNMNSLEHQAWTHDGTGQVDSSRAQQHVGGKHGHPQNQPSPNKKIRLGNGRQDMNSISLKKRTPGKPTESSVIIREEGADEEQQSRRLKYAIGTNGCFAKDQDNYLRDDMMKATPENTCALNQMQQGRYGHDQGDSKQIGNSAGPHFSGRQGTVFTKDLESDKTTKRNNEARTEEESFSKESGVEEQRGGGNYEGTVGKIRQVNRQDNYKGNEKGELVKDMGTVQPVFERKSQSEQQETADPDMGLNARNRDRCINEAMPTSGQVSKPRPPNRVNGIDQQKLPSLPVIQQGSPQVFDETDYASGLPQQDTDRTESSRMQPRIMNIQATNNSERESNSIKRPGIGNKTADYVPSTLMQKEGERKIEGVIQSYVNSNDFTTSKEVDGEVGRLCRDSGFQVDGPIGFGHYDQEVCGAKEQNVEMDGYRSRTSIKHTKQSSNNPQPQHGLGPMGDKGHMRIGSDFPSYKVDETYKQNETGSTIPELKNRLGSVRPIDVYGTTSDQDCESGVDDIETEIEGSAGTRSLSSARNDAEQDKEDFSVRHTFRPDMLALHGRVGGDGGVIKDMNLVSEQQTFEKDERYKNNDDVVGGKSTFSVEARPSKHQADISFSDIQNISVDDTRVYLPPTPNTKRQNLKGGIRVLKSMSRQEMNNCEKGEDPAATDVEETVDLDTSVSNILTPFILDETIRNVDASFEPTDEAVIKSKGSLKTLENGGMINDAPKLNYETSNHQRRYVEFQEQKSTGDQALQESSNKLVVGDDTIQHMETGIMMSDRTSSAKAGNERFSGRRFDSPMHELEEESIKEGRNKQATYHQHRHRMLMSDYKLGCDPADSRNQNDQATALDRNNAYSSNPHQSPGYFPTERAYRGKQHAGAIAEVANHVRGNHSTKSPNTKVESTVPGPDKLQKSGTSKSDRMKIFEEPNELSRFFSPTDERTSGKVQGVRDNSRAILGARGIVIGDSQSNLAPQGSRPEDVSGNQILASGSGSNFSDTMLGINQASRTSGRPVNSLGQGASSRNDLTNDYMNVEGEKANFRTKNGISTFNLTGGDGSMLGLGTADSRESFSFNFGEDSDAKQEFAQFFGESAGSPDNTSQDSSNAFCFGIGDDNDDEDEDGAFKFF